jgi:hypothetical protein
MEESFREFQELAVKEAQSEITDVEKKRLDVLISVRRSHICPRSREDVEEGLARRREIKELTKALEDSK